MSPGGRAEGMARLRRVIAEIEAEAGPNDRLARRLPLARAFDPPSAAGLRTTPCMRLRRLDLKTGRRRWALRWRWPAGS